MKHYLWIIFICLAIAGCTALPDGPSVAYEVGALQADDTFDDALGWDVNRQGDVSVGVEGGVYRIQGDVDRYVRGFKDGAYRDAMLVFDVAELSGTRNNAYGVMCRASFDDASPNGYYFLLSDEGRFSIRKGQGGEIRPLVRWQRLDVLTGDRLRHTLRVICVEDYLALYVDGVFAGEARDGTYSRGRVGFVGATESGTRLEATFDNMKVYDVRLGE